MLVGEKTRAYLKKLGLPACMHASREEGIRMGEQAALVAKMVEKYYPEAVQTKKGSEDLRIPK